MWPIGCGRPQSSERVERARGRALLRASREEAKERQRRGRRGASFEPPLRVRADCWPHTGRNVIPLGQMESCVVRRAPKSSKESSLCELAALFGQLLALRRQLFTGSSPDLMSGGPPELRLRQRQKRGWRMGRKWEKWPRVGPLASVCKALDCGNFVLETGPTDWGSSGRRRRGRRSGRRG